MIRHNHASWLAWLSISAPLFTLSTAAHADDATPAAEGESGAPQKKMDLSVPAMEQPVQRTEYVHNGFYFRFSVGPGFSYLSLRNQETNRSAGSGAFALASNLMVGGSPNPGFALGVGALTNLHLGASFDGDNAGGAFQATVGPFFDAFPDAKGPFHVGALVGMSAMGLGDDFTPANAVVGGGVGAWLGWDIFVAPEWSAGLKWQLGGAYMVGDEAAASTFNTNLMLTILRH